MRIRVKDEKKIILRTQSDLLQNFYRKGDSCQIFQGSFQQGKNCKDKGQ